LSVKRGHFASTTGDRRRPPKGMRGKQKKERVNAKFLLAKGSWKWGEG